jgi:hypothetical protein
MSEESSLHISQIDVNGKVCLIRRDLGVLHRDLLPVEPAGVVPGLCMRIRYTEAEIESKDRSGEGQHHNPPTEPVA